MVVLMAIALDACLVLFLGEAAEATEVRLWKDATGKYEVRAELVDANYDDSAQEVVVTLRKEDGKTLLVPLSRLSEDDRRFVELARKDRRKGAEDRQPTGVQKKAAEGIAKRKRVRVTRKDVEDALKQPITVEFKETPLPEAVKEIASKLNKPVGITIDVGALRQANISLAAPITIKLEEVALSGALRLMLRQHDLTYLVRDNAVFITTTKEANQWLRMHSPTSRRAARE